MQVLVDAMKSGDIRAEPVLVVSNSNSAGGLAKAQAAGVPTQVIAHDTFPDKAAFETALSAAIEHAEADLICLAGFMRVLSAAFTARWAGRILNIHPSLLPAFKGLDTHERALAAGCSVHGATVHHVTAQLDAGHIIGQAIVPVKAGDTPQSLAARVLKQEHRLYPAALRKFIAQDSDPLLLAPDE